MLNIGCHLSAAGGYESMAKNALSIGANTMQFFTRNPRGGAMKQVDPEDMRKCLELCRSNNFAPIVAHAPYTLNPCGSEQRVRDFALMAFTEDLQVLENLPGTLYNFHPGSHVGQGVEAGIQLIVELLNKILSEKLHTTVVLEAMSGKGSEVGSTFEELREIIDRTEKGDLLGVCIDTCHIYCAGYDIVNDLDGVVEKFDKVVGLDRLKAIHLNDSMMPFSSHKDRHEKIGKGTLGLEALQRVVNHPKLRHLPFILETPQDDLSGWQREIELLRASAVGM